MRSVHGLALKRFVMETRPEAMGCHGCLRKLVLASECNLPKPAVNTFVIDHVPLSELPPDWRSRLATAQPLLSHVTVRLEPEPNGDPYSLASEPMLEDPIFGMWHDRQDMADVQQCLRQWRSDRATLS